MTSSLFLQVAVPSSLWKNLDYLPAAETSANLKPGMRVKVPLGRRETIGILLDIVHTTTVPLEKLKPIIEIIDEEPIIPPSLLKLCRWASDYYHYPLGAVISAALPRLIRQGRSITDISLEQNHIASYNQDAPISTLYAEQIAAIENITAAKNFQTFLLWGITGSGKTEVYLRCVEEILTRGQQALILIPEIGLTPQTVNRFQERFSVPTVILNSNLSDKKRLHSWSMAKSGQAKIIIGTRSAIFIPLLNPGIIIVDEEHDASFKQQSGFRYSARDLAILRGTLENIPVILGSATPSLETLYNVHHQRYRCLSLPKRAGDAQLPTIHILDIRKKKLIGGLSTELLLAIEKQLANGGQVLLFLNRRGYASTLLCHACGFMMSCDYCDARLTLHYHPKRLYCHHCDAQKDIPAICPECKQSNFIPLGLGTERLEKTLQTHFPNYNVARIDRDNTRAKDSMAKKIEDIQNQKTHILVGTQMIAKGHHFPHLTLVAIVDADSGLYGSDFRAAEKMGQLLQQVAGRAGRAEKPGTVFLQTHHPDHPVLQILLHEGYAAFAKTLLQERRNARLPPFSHMALLHVKAKKKDVPYEFLLRTKQFILNQANHAVESLGPIPGTMERKAGYYHYQLLLQSIHRKALQQVLNQLKTFLIEQTKSSVHWALDVDPQEM